MPFRFLKQEFVVKETWLKLKLRIEKKTILKLVIWLHSSVWFENSLCVWWLEMSSLEWKSFNRRWQWLHLMKRNVFNHFKDILHSILCSFFVKMLHFGLVYSAPIASKKFPQILTRNLIFCWLHSNNWKRKVKLCLL